MFSAWKCSELNKKWIEKENNKKLLIIIENLNKSCNLSITYVKFESVTFDQIFMFVELKCQCNKKSFGYKLFKRLC